MRRLLDLFCGAGGAAKGYHDAGFEVVGVDIKPQPHYPYRFEQADALELLDTFMPSINGWWDEPAFDAIHASPPCQRHTSMQSVAKNADAHADLIGQMRELLERTKLPYIIENVVGARQAMREPFLLCGSMFQLETRLPRPDNDWMIEARQLRRHRLFEANWEVGLLPTCGHYGKALGVYGDHLRLGRRSSDGEFSGARALRYGKQAMGIDWEVSWDELKEAIPPAYTSWIGERLLTRLERARVEAAA